MKMILSEPEIRRAIQVYVAAKTGTATRDVDVHLHKHARNGVLSATIVIAHGSPTLTDKVVAA